MESVNARRMRSSGTARSSKPGAGSSCGTAEGAPLLRHLINGASAVLLVVDAGSIAHLAWSGSDRVTACVDDPDGWRAHLRIAPGALEAMAAHVCIGYARRARFDVCWFGAQQDPATPPTGAVSRTFFRSRSLWITGWSTPTACSC